MSCDLSLSLSMQAIQNLGLAIVPIVAGYIVDHNGYLMLEVFFLTMLSLALISGEPHKIYFTIMEQYTIFFWKIFSGGEEIKNLVGHGLVLYKFSCD